MGSRKLNHTLLSTTCHFSPTLSATIFHMCSRTSRYARAKASTLTPSQFSCWLRFSMRRSCLLRHALGVLVGKYCVAIGAQLRPWARARINWLSSGAVHGLDEWRSFVTGDVACDAAIAVDEDGTVYRVVRLVL